MEQLEERLIGRRFREKAAEEFEQTPQCEQPADVLELDRRQRRTAHHGQVGQRLRQRDGGEEGKTLKLPELFKTPRPRPLRAPALALESPRDYN